MNSKTDKIKPPRSNRLVFRLGVPPVFLLKFKSPVLASQEFDSSVKNRLRFYHKRLVDLDLLNYLKAKGVFNYNFHHDMSSTLVKILVIAPSASGKSYYYREHKDEVIDGDELLKPIYKSAPPEFWKVPSESKKVKDKCQSFIRDWFRHNNGVLLTAEPVWDVDPNVMVLFVDKGTRSMLAGFRNRKVEQDREQRKLKQLLTSERKLRDSIPISELNEEKVSWASNQYKKTMNHNCCDKKTIMKHYRISRDEAQISNNVFLTDSFDNIPYYVNFCFQCWSSIKRFRHGYKHNLLDLTVDDSVLIGTKSTITERQKIKYFEM